MTEEAAGQVELPEEVEERLNELRLGALQKAPLPQGEMRDLATELLAMLSPAVPNEEQPDK